MGARVVLGWMSEGCPGVEANSWSWCHAPVAIDRERKGTLHASRASCIGAPPTALVLHVESLFALYLHRLRRLAMLQLHPALPLRAHCELNDCVMVALRQ
jgi:hypothetical protein